MFHVGITPDFYVDAKGHFEEVVERLLGGVAGLDYAPMPEQPGKVATSAAVNECDAILAMAIRFTRDSVREVDRLAVIARWGVGYDMVDVDAMTEAGIALAITPNGVRRPVAEAIITLIFALAKNLREQDHLVRTGRWRDKVSRLAATCRKSWDPGMRQHREMFGSPALRLGVAGFRPFVSQRWRRAGC
jgi:phosphoglycerate dehydrogenase-like enzyme